MEIWLVWSSNEWTGIEDASSFEYQEHNVDNLALEAVGQNSSSEVISLFLEDCCQWTFLCQEVRGACKGSSESLGSPGSLCSECLEERRRCSDAKVPSYNGRPGV